MNLLGQLSVMLRCCWCLVMIDAFCWKAVDDQSLAAYIFFCLCVHSSARCRPTTVTMQSRGRRGVGMGDWSRSSYAISFVRAMVWSISILNS